MYLYHEGLAQATGCGDLSCPGAPAEQSEFRGWNCPIWPQAVASLAEQWKVLGVGLPALVQLLEEDFQLLN